MPFVVIGPYCHGSGRSVMRAIQIAFDNYPRFGCAKNYSEMSFNIYDASDDWDVNAYGSISASQLTKLAEYRYNDATRGGRV